MKLLLFIFAFNNIFYSNINGSTLLSANQDDLQTPTQRNCSSPELNTSIGQCYRPLVKLWENVRSYENSDLAVFPVPFYSKESILFLCQLHSKTKDECQALETANELSCGKNDLINFFDSHLNFFCGRKEGLKYYKEFECAGKLLKRAKTGNDLELDSCFQNIREIPMANYNLSKCNRIPRFMNCISSELKKECGIHATTLLQDAVKDYGCNLGDDKDYRKMFGVVSNSLPRKMELKNQINENAHLKDGAKLLSSPRKYQSGKCSLKKQAKIASCYTPLINEWDQINSNYVERKNYYLPLFQYGLSEIGLLCEVLDVILDNCMSTEEIEDCLGNEIISYVDQEIGQVCKYQTERKFSYDYHCLQTILQTDNHCLHLIKGRNLPGLDVSKKCRNHNKFFNCIKPDVVKFCNTKSLTILEDIIVNYNCKISTKSSQSSIHKNRDEPIKPTRSEIFAGRKLENTSSILIKKQKLVTKKGEVIMRGKEFVYELGNDCGQSNLLKSRICSGPVVSELESYKLESKLFITLPVLIFEKHQILELCDSYTNIQLCAGIEAGIACQQDSKVRYLKDNIGYICNPSNISAFLKNFSCISLLIKDSYGDCTRFIGGHIFENRDHRKCRGIQQFYDCLKEPVLERCGENAQFQLNEYLRSFGCL